MKLDIVTAIFCRDEPTELYVCFTRSPNFGDSIKICAKVKASIQINIVTDLLYLTNIHYWTIFVTSVYIVEVRCFQYGVLPIFLLSHRWLLVS